MVMTQFVAKVGQTDYDKQAITVPGSQEPGYSPIYRNAMNPNVTTSETIYDLFTVGRNKSGNKPCLGHRPWDASIGDFSKTLSWLTYGEVEELRTAVGSGLAHLAKEGKLGNGVGISNWMIGIWCQNRPGEFISSS
jgi:long-chain acyl-CoA synthetase